MIAHRLLPLVMSIAIIGCCKQDADSSGASNTQQPGNPTEPATTATAATAATTTTTAPAGAPGKLMGSCMIMGVACSDYYGSADKEIVKKACQAAGKWSDTACPTAGVQGTCTKTELGGIVNKTHTYPPGTKATAKEACDNTPGGVFSG